MLHLAHSFIDPGWLRQLFQFIGGELIKARITLFGVDLGFGLTDLLLGNDSLSLDL